MNSDEALAEAVQGLNDEEGGIHRGSLIASGRVGWEARLRLGEP